LPVQQVFDGQTGNGNSDWVISTGETAVEVIYNSGTGTVNVQFRENSSATVRTLTDPQLPITSSSHLILDWNAGEYRLSITGASSLNLDAWLGKKTTAL
jgi:hypothetical protein